MDPQCTCEGLCVGHTVPTKFKTQWSKRIWRDKAGSWLLVENQNDGRGDLDIFLYQER